MRGAHLQQMLGHTLEVQQLQLLRQYALHISTVKQARRFLAFHLKAAVLLITQAPVDACGMVMLQPRQFGSDI